MAELIVLSLLAFIILMGFIGNLIFNKTNIPSTLWLLILGVLLGQVFHIVDRTSLMSMSNILSAVAIITILSDGGMSLNIKETIIEAPRGFLLMIVGIIFSVLVATGTMYLFGFPLLLSLFTGLILSGTSASVIIPIITKMKGLNEKTKTILSFESISDTFTLVIALVVLDFMLGEIPSFSLSVISNPILSGIALGILVGIIWSLILGKLRKEEHTYAATLGVLFLTYVFAESIDASGAIACFLAGLMLGNSRYLFKFIGPELGLKPDFSTAKFHSLISFFVRTFYFVFLGALLLITDYTGLLIGVLICVGFLIVRIFYINILTFGNKQLTSFDKNTMMIMFPRGLSTAVLATIPLTKGVQGADIIIDIAFAVILGTIIISTIGMFYIMRKEHKKMKEAEEGEKTIAQETEEEPID